MTTWLKDTKLSMEHKIHDKPAVVAVAQKRN